MGCVTSKTDINDLHSNIFQVMNVDEMCNPLMPGQLEVSHSDLVLHQRGKTPVRWPLRCLRRYGCDAQLFSFECGRRCATGPGIYAFKCARAETLFNLLQTRVQMSSASAEDTVSNATAAETNARPVESNYLEPTAVTMRQRLGSIGGPLSPSSPFSPLPTSNNNCEFKCVYTNFPLTPTSLNFDNLSFIDGDSQPTEDGLDEEPPSTPFYMNVVIGGQETVSSGLPLEPAPEPMVVLETPEAEERHCYANLEPGEIRHNCFQPVTPPPSLNYIQVDLDRGHSPLPSSPITPTATAVIPVPAAVTSPQGYTTIDFDRTMALCAVNNCPQMDDEGSRKTRHNFAFLEERPEERVVKRPRHNSTISDLIAPIAARLSASFSE